MRSDSLSVRDVRVSGGFWGRWRGVMQSSTVNAVYDRFEETGRFAALKCDWKDGEDKKPHIFWDSDTAKWIEGAAYLLMDARDPALEARVDGLVADMAASQWPDGYFNSYFITVEPSARFTRRDDHELYCLGHLTEAAIAYDQATGKRALLDLVIRYADLVCRAFCEGGEAKFATPGHEEIELALYKLYRYTGEKRYLCQMRRFIDLRGNNGLDRHPMPMNVQSHKPAREQREAVGHAVRAGYLYAAMADLAWEDGDADLADTCRALFHSVADKRMYVTGATGSIHWGETFTFDYDLPNREAYAETCASIALALFARRMLRIEPKAEYADVAERALMNGALSGVSLSGDAFFYENPLETQADKAKWLEGYTAKASHKTPSERKRVFGCSCCPPNVLRVYSSMQEYAFTQSRDTLFAHLYMSCEAETAFGHVSETTEYPNEGEIRFSLPEGDYRLALRVPRWAKAFSLAKNGVTVKPDEEKDGYVYLNGPWAAGDTVLLALPMDVRLTRAHPLARENAGRVCVERGPLVYCAEGVDVGPCPGDLRVGGAAFSPVYDDFLGAYALETEASFPLLSDDLPLYSDCPYPREKRKARLIPYYARANRGASDMAVWLLEE